MISIFLFLLTYFHRNLTYFRRNYPIYNDVILKYKQILLFESVPLLKPLI